MGVDRTGWLRSGEREADEACPVVDHRDLGVDMETTAERPPAGTDRVSENVCCFLLIVLLCMHTNLHSCIYVCVCLTENVKGLFVSIS